MEIKFADAEFGARFMTPTGSVLEKIEPVYEAGPKGRRRYRGNCRNVATGKVARWPGHVTIRLLEED